MNVFSKTCGGIGNVFFQIAAGIGVAENHYCDFFFDERLRTPSSHLPDEILIDKFLDRVPRLDYRCNNYGVYKERDFSFCGTPFLGSSWLQDYDLVLDGYWQSEKYFEKHKEKVISFLKCEETKPNGYCAIHVRRGDYLGLSNYHTNLGLDYYHIAMNVLKSKKFLIFSDDMDFCKSVFKGRDFSFYEDSDTYATFYEMASCSEFIIANSTFSWWAAYLSQANRVVAPSNWFGPDGPKKHDLIPERWITV